MRERLVEKKNLNHLAHLVKEWGKIVIYFISVEKCSLFFLLFIFFLAFGPPRQMSFKKRAIEEGPRGATKKKVAKKDA